MMTLAQKVRDANEIENEIDGIDERSQYLAEALTGIIGKTLPAQMFNMYTGHRGHLRTRRLTAESRLAKAEKKIEEQRQVLVKAGIDRKTMEIMKEHQKDDHMKAEAVKEQNEQDELAAMAKQWRERDI